MLFYFIHDGDESSLASSFSAMGICVPPPPTPKIISLSPQTPSPVAREATAQQPTRRISIPRHIPHYPIPPRQ
ncbi:hypothetical protein CYLTODRAFT_423652 [Cylindrobasidium torrendii FP15055 ss-10]|uniref:Uncharacterized protein n=1 Tax=Cylindrobasidium torrendii FP15055 ss-10 TaxID=1314674 RepID=A0A0D7B6V3_9AGAR|nr:hypothetical protein CYLTODRAFT_423652 [Cylindrobasidium torrendii FP15055 ss-10]